MLKYYIESLVNFTNKQLGNIVYIGAGSGGQVSKLCELKPTSLVAVESSQQLFDVLERKLKKYPFTSLYNNWVFPGSDIEGIVCLYNNPRFNSVKPSTEFIGGNIKLEKEEYVKGSSLESILIEHDLPENLLNVLVLDFLNAEQFLAELTKSIDTMRKLNFVVVPKVSFLQKQQELSISEYFEYTAIPTFDEGKFYIFQINHVFLTYKKTLEIDKVNNKLELDEVNAQLKSVKESLTNKLNEAESEKESLTNKLNEAESEKVVSVKKFEQVRKELERTASTAIAQEEEARKKLEEIIRSRDALKKEITTLKDTIKQQEQVSLKFDEQLELIKKQKELQYTELTKEAEESKALERESANTADLTYKLNLKLQADLDELRQKYTEKIKVEEELTKLVNDLYVKLKLAVDFYHVLELEHPEIASGKHA